MLLSTKPAFVLLSAYVLLLFSSCQKNTDSPEQLNVLQHKLETEDETIVKIRQAIAIHDGTALGDSIAFVNPPTNRYYKWRILPNNGCVIVYGENGHGKASITFNCSGKYQVSAEVFDSANNRLVATTDTIQFEVTKDTLRRSQPLNPTDVLVLKTNISKGWSSDQAYASGSPADRFSLSFSGKTTVIYEGFDWGNEIAVSSKNVDNHHTYAFSDSVNLSSFPFARYKSHFRPVYVSLHLGEKKPGIPISLSITWLGKTYEGKFVFRDENNFTVEWDNSGKVKIE